jgi:hypothetical protein
MLILFGQNNGNLISALISQEALMDVLTRFLISLVLLALLVILSYWKNVDMEQDFLFSFARDLSKLS